MAQSWIWSLHPSLPPSPGTGMSSQPLPLSVWKILSGPVHLTLPGMGGLMLKFSTTCLLTAFVCGALPENDVQEQEAWIRYSALQCSTVWWWRGLLCLVLPPTVFNRALGTQKTRAACYFLPLGCSSVIKLCKIHFTWKWFQNLPLDFRWFQWEFCHVSSERSIPRVMVMRDKEPIWETLHRWPVWDFQLLCTS